MDEITQATMATDQAVAKHGEGSPEAMAAGRHEITARRSGLALTLGCQVGDLDAFVKRGVTPNVGA